VKRLLTVDNEAMSVKWEVITEELNANKGGEAGKDNPDVKLSVSGGFTNDPKDLGLDLFDSDGEGRDVDIDSEENCRLSAGDDSRYDEEEI
jgi:transcription initiation factor TFIID subunit 7